MRPAAFRRSFARDLRSALDTAERIATEVFLPHRRKSDVEEPEFDGERVHLIPEVKASFDAFAEAGLLAAAADYDYGGMQLPPVVDKACFAYVLAANVGSAGYPLLTAANANLLLAHGSPAQIDAFVRPMLAGRFTGTMCLSEPQAGSSLTDIVTRAEPDGESPLGPRYRLSATRCGSRAASTRSPRTSCTWCWRRSRAGRRA